MDYGSWIAMGEVVVLPLTKCSEPLCASRVSVFNQKKCMHTVYSTCMYG
jgi:hypothetical protein